MVGGGEGSEESGDYPLSLGGGVGECSVDFVCSLVGPSMLGVV